MTTDGSNRIPLIGLGASAGGLEALKVYFESTPPDTGAAFVVVQHLSPDFKSLMPEILQRHTEMEIQQVTERVQIQANHVYLLAPGLEIQVEGDFLAVDQRGDRSQVQHPITRLFSSMAEECEGTCFAIILSGTGTDGAIGTRAVKQSGGVVLVQEPESARFDGMPRAAMATGSADFQLPPAQLAEKVVALLHNPSLARIPEKSFSVRPEMSDYDAVLHRVLKTTGMSFAEYKSGTIMRRILRRMAIHGIETPNQYVDFLDENPDEPHALARDCLIHVTQFFRDPEAFASLKTHLEGLIDTGRFDGRPLRAWVVGCSTGEEAFSLGILLDDLLAERDPPGLFKIFATDLDTDAVETASAGRYPKESVANLRSAELEQYFIAEDDALVVDNGLRNRMVFTRHNVLSDPPFPRADLILCRNLLIYFKHEAQEAALSRIGFSLTEGGVLFLGPSEVLKPYENDYAAMDAKWRIFTKTTSRKYPHRAANPFSEPARFTDRLPTLRGARRTPTQPDLIRACEGLASELAHCGVVIAESGEVIHSFGETGGFLRFAKGKPSNHIGDLLPAESLGAVRVALRESKATHTAVPVEVETDSGVVRVESLHIAENAQSAPLDILIVKRVEAASAQKPAPPLGGDLAAHQEIADLESQLQSTRASLQATIEELESTNEEMQSVNEELIASNEELQSTNQELHSVNEELYTVNAEHEGKISELAEVSEDLQRLLNATNVGVLFLDHELIVRKFTPGVHLGLPVRDSDIGRSVEELSSRVDVDLTSIIRGVLATGEEWETQLLNTAGIAVGITAQRYVSRSIQKSGCLLTTVKIPEQPEDSPVAPANAPTSTDG